VGGDSSFVAARFFEALGARGGGLGRPHTAAATTESTNDDALRAARAGAPHGAVFVADRQTRGRGRRGHVWRSEPGLDLTFSIVLRPELPLGRVTTLPLLAGLAVRAAAAARVATEVGVKWPNDVVAGGRKLAGILSESVLDAGRVAAVVVGIGVNVRTRDFPDELAPSATSLLALGATRLEREDLLADVLAQLAPRLAAHRRGGFEPFVNELARYDALNGQPVSVEGVSGVARGIDAEGALLIEDASGALHSIVAGTVTLRS
jgi:BirA family transcriptional regulator, biotin operon repressor / biotin---[acetyl-CoA-carboxylase] ligase